MLSALAIAGILVAVFVGFNIGGSSTGVAFGPAVGSRLVRKATAAGLFTLFAFVGAWTVGRNVIDTMSSSIVPASAFTPVASVGVLLFTGLSLLVSNVYGVPASTSMTAVGGIVGLGLATGTLDEALMFTIVSAWVVAPLVGLASGALIGRYVYPHLDRYFAFTRLERHLIQVDRSGTVPRPRFNRNASLRDLAGSLTVVVIACYMGFSAGASNAANAVAPLVGAQGPLTVDQGVTLAVAAFGLGGFTIARRTLDTVGDDITELPILAALVVSVVGGTIITALSYFGIPASLAVSTTCCIIGLGWGRASRPASFVDLATPELASTTPARERPQVELTTGALAASPTEAEEGPHSPTVGELAEGKGPKPAAPDGGEAPVPHVGEEDPDHIPHESLFDPTAAGRIVFMWVFTPTVAVVCSYALFSLAL
jgi:PiT family inorganic phosphate transporter